MADSGSTPVERQLAQLKDQLVERITELNQDVSFWRPRAFFGQICIASLGALISVLAGIKGELPQTITAWLPSILNDRNNWILLLGAVISIVGAWQAFYNHRDRWLTYAAGKERLRALLAKVEFQQQSPPDSDEAKKLFGELYGILGELNRIEVAALAKPEKKNDA